MKITVGKSKRIMASEDYATLRGMDFKKARDILTKDGFHEHEYGDKDDNNGYAVYRKGDKEVELQYRWNQGKRKGEAHAGKVTNVYVDDDINSACGKKSAKRRPVKAAESYGWVVDENEAWEAYEFACDYFGKENLDDQIVSGLSTDELAESLVYIFRMNDFREWDERNGSSDDDEDDEEVELELIDAGEEFTDVDDVIAYVKANATSLTDDDLEAAQDYLLDEYNIYKRSDYLNTTDTFKQLDSILDIIDAEQERRANMNDLDGRTIGESIRAKGRKSIKSSKRNTRRPVKAARITTDFSNFKPWSGAVDTWNELEKWDKIDLLEQILDDTYYSEEAGEAVLSETELNDLLWFEPETVYEWVGLYYNDETGEVSDEPFDSDDEDDYDED